MRLKPQVPLTIDWFKLKLDEETLLVLIESECFLPSDIWERSVDQTLRLWCIQVKISRLWRSWMKVLAEVKMSFATCLHFSFGREEDRKTRFLRETSFKCGFALRTGWGFIKKLTTITEYNNTFPQFVLFFSSFSLIYVHSSCLWWIRFKLDQRALLFGFRA